MSTEPREARARLLATARRIAAALLGLLQTRLALLGVELQEERQRLLAVAGWAAAAFLLCGLGLLFVGLFAVAAWGEEHRLLALGVVAAVFIGAALAAYAQVRRYVRDGTRLFAASLSELERDGEVLGGREP